MKLNYTLKEALEISKNSNCDLLPISSVLDAGSVLPGDILAKIKAQNQNCFLLESALPDRTFGRYSYLSYNPKMNISCKNGKFEGFESSLPPKEALQQLLKSSTMAKDPSLPPFAGGLAGSFSFEFFGYSEPSADLLNKSDNPFDDFNLIYADKLICFDNFADTITLIACMKLDEGELGYFKAVRDLIDMKNLILKEKIPALPSGKLESRLKPAMDMESYCSMVEEAKDHIAKGDIFQIVLSNPLKAPYKGSIIEKYFDLANTNPSPYLFYFCQDDLEITGCSPETLIKLENETLHTYPLAGTRKRGVTKQADLLLEKELLADEKELAEHDMLIDLGRNDLGRISKIGSVKVETCHSILRYSHVMHIGSSLVSTIDKDKDALDVLDSMLPAGTLSGAPKIKACSLISSMESEPRGIYGGAFGYISFSGNMDLCIAIRLAVLKSSTLYIRSGAGIVADSVAKNEYFECLNKAKAVIEAFEG